MKRTLVILLFLLVGGTMSAKEVLFTCGEGRDQGFEGWTIQPYKPFEWVDFSENQLSLYCEKGGEYSITLMRELDELVGYSTLFLDLAMEISPYSLINHVNVFFSMDGSHWDAVQDDALNKEVQLTNGRMNYLFVKIVANVSFFTAGKLTFKGLTVSGEYESELEPVQEEETLVVDPHPVHPDLGFYIFCYNGVITVETQNEKPYEAVLINLSGQIIQRTYGNGSMQFQTECPAGIYLVTIIQDNQVLSTTKVSL